MKKILSFLLAVIFAVGVSATVRAAVDGAFSDVGADRWSAGNIAYAVEKGYMQGVGGGKFDPEGTLTRAMVVTVLWRMSGSPAVAYRRAFTDVPDGEWFTSAVIWAKSEGVVKGVTATTFDPDGAITREQLATMISRFASFLKYKVEPAGSIDAYPLVAQVVSDSLQPHGL